MEDIRLLIADDHELFRRGIAELVKKHEGLTVVREARDGQELLDLLNQGVKADVILLDLSMPRLNGFEALEEITRRYPEISVIIISMHDEGSYIAKCAQNGADGYLLKNTDEAELVSAIRVVSRGKKYFGPEITEKMVNAMAEPAPYPKKLSKKESEVLKWLAEGHTTKEIAHNLFLSTRTIETHRANILKKLDAKNTAELIRKAVELGII